MKKSLLIISALGGVIASPLQAEQKAPSGIGTGVTIAIAPPGGSPAGCVTDYNGHFAIAAINATNFKEVFGNGMQGGNTELKDGGSDNMVAMGAPPAAKGKAAKAVDPAPRVTGIARLLNHAKAAQDEDITITVRMTRTHIRTVTVQSNLGKGKPAMASRPTEAAPPPTFKGDKVKAAVLYQIGDGQVQAPVKPIPIPLPAPKTSNKPFAPLASNAPGKISQIGDGQIQAPTGTPKPARARPGPKGPAGGASPKGPAGDSFGLGPAGDSFGPGPAGPAAPKRPASGSSGSAPAGDSFGLGPAMDSLLGPDLMAPPPPAAGPPAGGSMAGMSGHGGHSKRAANKPSFCAGGKPVRLTLTGGILKDQDGRTGYIADNRQFQ